MPDSFELASLLVAAEFVVLSVVLLVVVPFEVAAPVVPLLLVFMLALWRYRS
ncbi:hypothetical protein [Halorarius halobius]|uniref:hypothetical protein n=1 Tax=Halorarius halobius TaxID=2962671 RepID=UPI0020CDB97D|nr:hypothetical protein [Halorarius halobius]